MREPSLFDALEDLQAVGWTPDEPPQIYSKGIKQIVLNFETSGLRWWAEDRPLSVTVRLPDGSIFFLPWGHRGGNLDEATLRRWAQTELRDVHILNINTRFDVHMARAWGVDLEAQGCTVQDVSHMVALLEDHRMKFSLDALAEDFLGGFRVPRVDESRMIDYHASQVAPRARHQVELVHELYEQFQPRIEAEDLGRVLALENQVIFVVCEMERNGAPIDVELLDRWLAESQKKYEGYLWDLVNMVGFQVDPNRPEHRLRLWNHLKLPMEYLPSGRPSFTDAIVATVDHPAVQLMRKAAKLSSLRSKFLTSTKKSLGSDGILRYALHQLRATKSDLDESSSGTVTGRFSSTAIATGEGVNIQQRMKAAKQRVGWGYDEDDATHDDEIYLVRKLHVAREGLVLSSDMDQAQYRIFASYAGNPKVIQAYQDNPNLSFHKLMHEMIRPYAKLTYRQQKDTNFAYLFGAGATKMALMLGHITAAEFEDIKRRKDYQNAKLAQTYEVRRIYEREVPEMKQLLDLASHLGKPACDAKCSRSDVLHQKHAHRGYVKTKEGRRMRFPDGQRLHKAFNGIDQMTEADAMKRKLVELHRERKTTGLTLRITNHDEVVGDIPDAEHAKLVDEILNRQTHPGLKVPLTWSTGIGPSWAECK